LQLLFLTMTSVASSTVTFPLLRILHSLKTGSPLALSTAEIYQHFPLIHWLISTPSLSPSTVTGPSFRMRLLTRLLACSPALARPLRDATGRALQLAVREQIFSPQGTVSATSEGRSTWMSLLTMAWAIDSITSQSRRHRRAMGVVSSSSLSMSTVKGAGIGKIQSRVPSSGRRRSYGKMGPSHQHQHQRSTRSSWSSSSTGTGETMSSVLLGKQL
jgi:transcriptional activator HAC1